MFQSRPKRCRPDPLRRGFQTVACGDDTRTLLAQTFRNGGSSMIVLGVILLILGLVLDLGILWTIGIILVVIGIILWILGMLDRAVLGRRYWW
jgi:hypothetical protein